MIKTFEVSEESPSLRLDKFLSRRFPEHSRSYFQYLINHNFVILNGHPVKKQHKPQSGDLIELEFHLPPEIDVQPENIPLDILYEDDYVIIINKPVGMVVHPAPGSPSKTFVNALLYHCQSLNPSDFDTLRPGIVHRIDKETSGILIAAKTQQVHRELTQQFSKRLVEKTYLTICCGTPREGKYSVPIKRDPNDRKRMTTSEDGKEAISSFKILAKHKELSLVEVKIQTGRTHQIRAHLKSMNCPILGDSIYGSPTFNRRYEVTRQMLHAYTLKLFHPLSKKSLEGTAPIPNDMKKFIDLIKRP